MLPIELLITIDRYNRDNCNLMYMNSTTFEQIKRVNLVYWKTKYLEKAAELNISKIALNDDNLNYKYEYNRLIRQAELINSLYIYCPDARHFAYVNTYCPQYNQSNGFIDKYINDINKNNSNNMVFRFKIIYPYCSFDIKQYEIPKEFKNLQSLNLNLNDFYHHDITCQQCLKKITEEHRKTLDEFLDIYFSEER